MILYNHQILTEGISSTYKIKIHSCNWKKRLGKSIWTAPRNSTTKLAHFFESHRYHTFQQQ